MDFAFEGRIYAYDVKYHAQQQLEGQPNLCVVAMGEFKKAGQDFHCHASYKRPGGHEGAVRKVFQAQDDLGKFFDFLIEAGGPWQGPYILAVARNREGYAYPIEMHNLHAMSLNGILDGLPDESGAENEGVVCLELRAQLK